MTEEEKLDVQERCAPLFDLFLRFERAFERLAIDRFDISDADAGAMATLMERNDTGAGRAFAYFMRHIVTARVKRRVFHAAQAVFESWRAAGIPTEGLTLDEAVEGYRKLHGGDA